MISQRARYAFKAMVALARAKPGEGLQIRQLCEQEKLPRKFLEQIKVEKLKLYVDPTAKASSTLKAIGLPTTLLLKNGKEVGRLVGPAEWDSAEAKTLIKAALQ